MNEVRPSRTLLRLFGIKWALLFTWLLTTFRRPVGPWLLGRLVAALLRKSAGARPCDGAALHPWERISSLLC